MKGIETELAKMESWNDVVGDLMKFQFQHMKQELLKDLLVELIRSGADFKEIDESVNIPIYGNYKGKSVEATFNPFSQKVFYKGSLLESPAAAAIQAKIDCGAPLENTENGWTWWRYLDENGEEKKITEFRKR